MAPASALMTMPSYVPTYHNLSVSPPEIGTVHVNYVEAEDTQLPTFLLLHGFPSDSNQIRDLIPMLSNDYHVLAPDFPGYGLTTVESDNFKYTFDNIAAVVSSLLEALHITSYAIYIFDYGAPVGLRLALANPSHVKAIVTQSGNAYETGFGHPFWDPIEKLWNTDDSQSARDWLGDNYLTLAATKMQYVTGVPDKDQKLINPKAYNSDHDLNEEGKKRQKIQLDLFFDYRTYKDLYPKVHEYFRKTQVPLLAVWGKGDPIFVPPGAEAFERDLPKAEIHLIDAGHFALETKRWEIAQLALEFLSKVKF